VLELIWHLIIHEGRRLPTINDITRTLNIKEDNLESIDYAYKNNHSYYFIKLVSRGVFCPKCGRYTTKVHAYDSINLNHTIFIGFNTTIIYKRRRYICPDCNVTKSEQNPFQSSHPKLTNETVKNVLKLLKTHTATFSHVAKTLNISPTMAQQIFDEHVQIERKPLSTALCLDEFYFSRRSKHKYACLLINFKNGLLLDVIESRKKGSLRAYFRSIPLPEREKVRYVSIDLYDNYRDIARIYLPNAIICADRFHVMKIINGALNKIRCKVMNVYEENKKSDEYYLLKHKNDLLFKDSLKINDEEADNNRHFRMRYTEGQLLEMMLNIDERLKIAYNLKELYCHFCEAELTTEERENLLETIINEFKLSNVDEMTSVSATLQNWKQEIINSFSTFDGRKISNGPIEGRNKLVKLVLQIANGYTNFKRFRNRIMYVLNKHETYSEDVLDSSNIRNVGNLRGNYKQKKKK